MPNLSDIDQLTAEYAVSYGELSGLMREIEDELASVKRAYLPKLRRLLTAAADRRSALAAAVETAPELFERPRSLTLHGIKVGLQKGKGSVEWADKDQTVKLIKKWLPEQIELLIKTTETPVKTALVQLPAATLKKLGVTVVETGDEVVIKPMDGEIERLVEALLKDTETELQQQAEVA